MHSNPHLAAVQDEWKACARKPPGNTALPLPQRWHLVSYLDLPSFYLSLLPVVSQVRTPSSVPGAIPALTPGQHWSLHHPAASPGGHPQQWTEPCRHCQHQHKPQGAAFPSRGGTEQAPPNLQASPQAPAHYPGLLPPLQAQQSRAWAAGQSGGGRKALAFH